MAIASGLGVEVSMALKHPPLPPFPAPPETPFSQGYTALLIACQSGTLDLAVFLNTNGANVSAVTNRGMSALHLAAEGGDVDLVHMLFMAGVGCILFGVFLHDGSVCFRMMKYY